MEQPTPYSDLNAVLAELVVRVQGALGDTFVGAYLQGSFAVGDFDQHSDVDTLLVKCVVREMGVTLAGPSPATLVDPIPVDALREETRATICDWGREVLDRPEVWANRFYQGYLVLNYARMLHDLTVGRPGSKRAGAEWAKARFGPAWADLIDRAWGRTAQSRRFRPRAGGPCRLRADVGVRTTHHPRDGARLAPPRVTTPVGRAVCM